MIARRAWCAGGVLALLLTACASRSDAPKETALPTPASNEAQATADPVGGPRRGGCPSPADLTLVIDQRLLDDHAPSTPLLVEHAFDDGGPKGLLPEGKLRRSLGDDEAKALGVPVGTGPVWVLGDAKRPPCRLEAGRRSVVVGDDPWETTPLVVVELTGSCAIDHLDLGRLAVRRPDEPSRCTLGSPGTVAAPLAESPAAPAEARAAFDPFACRKPRCDLRTIVEGFEGPGGRKIEWSVATRVWVDPTTDECHWQRDDFMASLVRDGPSAPVTLLESEGLDEVLLEGDVVVGFVDRNVERFDAYAWPPGKPPVRVATKQSFWAHDEDREIHSLGAYCGP